MQGKVFHDYLNLDIWRICDNGPLRFTVELTYAPNADGVTEHRIISHYQGAPYTYYFGSA